MIESKSNASKKLKEICASLGNLYEIKIINSEHVLYRDLDNGYCVGVFGLNNGQEAFDATVYIWDISGHPNTVEEKISPIISLNMLKQCLREAEKKYLTPRSSALR